MVRNYKRKTEDRWSKEDLLEALTLIKEKKCKINDAARQFGISRATLYRQNNKFKEGTWDLNQFRTCGGNPILNRVEEDVLEKTILDLREQGFSVTSSDIKRICFEYCDSNGIPNQFNKEKRMASDDWYYGFLKRHSNIRNYSSSKSEDSSSADDEDSKCKKLKKKIVRKKGKSSSHDLKLKSKKVAVKREPDEDDEEYVPESSNNSRKRKIGSKTSNKSPKKRKTEIKSEVKAEPADDEDEEANDPHDENETDGNNTRDEDADGEDSNDDQEDEGEDGEEYQDEGNGEGDDDDEENAVEEETDDGEKPKEITSAGEGQYEDDFDIELHTLNKEDYMYSCATDQNQTDEEEEANDAHNENETDAGTKRPMMKILMMIDQEDEGKDGDECQDGGNGEDDDGNSQDKTTGNKTAGNNKSDEYVDVENSDSDISVGL